METVTVQRTRTTVDLLLWRRFGVAGMGMLEQTLELNPGLSELGTILPVGTVVNLPSAPIVSAPTRPVLSLFGDD